MIIKNENLQTLIQSNTLNTFSSNFASNLTPVLTTLKESLENLNPNKHQLQNNISNLIIKIENLIQEQINNPKIDSKLNDDIKSTLLQMQDELASKTDLKSGDLTKQIDKLLTQLDNIASQTNYNGTTLLQAASGTTSTGEYRSSLDPDERIMLAKKRKSYMSGIRK